MREGKERDARERAIGNEYDDLQFEFLPPRDSTDFWRSMVAQSTDEASNPGAKIRRAESQPRVYQVSFENSSVGLV